MINLKLIEYIVLLQNTVIYLITILFGKLVSIVPDEPVRKEYRKLEVDELPKLQRKELLDYNELLKNHYLEKGRHLNPVNSRGGNQVPKTTICPRCKAPHYYIYDNNGGKGQYLCKICKTPFKPNIKIKTITFKCPHCDKALELRKQRKDFNVYRCPSDKCTYYLNKIKQLNDEEKEIYSKDPGKLKLRYIFREFNINFDSLSPDNKVKFKVDLSRIRVSKHLLGLILTYSVNYGLGLRKTASLLKDVHGIDISHQSISNYLNAASLAVQPLIQNYDYDLSGSYCGDETYVRVNGKWHYIFFFMDSIKRTILCHRISPNRDTVSCIHAINDVLLKIKDIPSNLKFITDGNPIYLLAQQFFAQNGVYFDVEQVIGLSNVDETSKLFRPLKQSIERLNRTYKSNYKGTGGFGCDDGSIAHVTLFTAFYNFLRPHSSIEDKPPVEIPEVASLPHMPARWGKILELSQEYWSVSA